MSHRISHRTSLGEEERTKGKRTEVNVEGRKRQESGLLALIAMIAGLE